MNKKIMPFLFLIPTVLYLTAYLLTYNNPETAATVANFAVPLAIAQMFMAIVIGFTGRNHPKSTMKHLVVVVSAILLIIMVSSVSIVQANVVGSLLENNAYIYGNVKVWVDPSHNWYAFYLYTDSATYFKNQAELNAQAAYAWVSGIGGSSAVGLLANWIRVPSKFNPLGAAIAGLTTTMTLLQLQQINTKIQQNYNPSQGIILFISNTQPVMIYNWWGNRYETVSLRSEFNYYACEKLASLYGTNGWATYYGCYLVWT